MHLQEFTSKSQEDCRKNRTSALIAEVRAAIPAIILDYPALTVLKASLQRSWCGLLGVRHQNSHGSEAKIRAAWFLEAGRPFYVRVFNPKKREAQNKTIKGNGAKAMLKMINDIPVIQPRFIVKTKIHIRCENALTKKTLKKLQYPLWVQSELENKSKKRYKTHTFCNV